MSRDTVVLLCFSFITITMFIVGTIDAQKEKTEIPSQVTSFLKVDISSINIEDIKDFKRN